MHLAHHRRGVSSGFGRRMTEQLLARGDRVVGTIRTRAETSKVADLVERYPETFHPETLDVRDTAAVREVVDRSFAQLGRVDVIISNAGYGLFGAAEELTDQQVRDILDTNLLGPIALVRAALPHLRAQGGGRVIQISSYGGQVAVAGNSLYHATKWGVEGFRESVAQEVAPFGVGVTIVEPGGARTEFRYGSAQVATPIPLEEFEALTRVPIVVLYGDNIPTEPTDVAGRDNWRVRQDMAQVWVDTINGTAGTRRSCRCPSRGSAATPTSRSATSTTTRSPTRSAHFSPIRTSAEKEKPMSDTDIMADAGPVHDCRDNPFGLVYEYPITENEPGRVNIRLVSYTFAVWRSPRTCTPPRITTPTAATRRSPWRTRTAA